MGQGQAGQGQAFSGSRFGTRVDNSGRNHKVEGSVNQLKLCWPCYSVRMRNVGTVYFLGE